MITIELISKRIKEISEKGIAIGEAIKKDFESKTVRSAAEYLSELPLLDGAEAIVSAAIKSLQALHDLCDDDGFKGRLLTMTAQITAIEHAAHHEWQEIIHMVQTVFSHLKSTNK